MGFSSRKNFAQVVFIASTTDSRVLFLFYELHYIILCVVVDKLEFTSNATSMLDLFKEKLSATIDLKLFGVLKSLIGWEISQNNVATCV